MTALVSGRFAQWLLVAQILVNGSHPDHSERTAVRLANMPTYREAFQS